MATASIALGRGKDFSAYKTAGIILLLFAVALATRAGRIGDPTIQVDEQFYLLVADRMWHGALPYVDIWDRKPILLFLIYAALRPLSPDGIVAYQIGALFFATATAFVIVMTRSVSPIWAAPCSPAGLICFICRCSAAPAVRRRCFTTCSWRSAPWK